MLKVKRNLLLGTVIVSSLFTGSGVGMERDRGDEARPRLSTSKTKRRSGKEKEAKPTMGSVSALSETHTIKSPLDLAKLIWKADGASFRENQLVKLGALTFNISPEEFKKAEDIFWCLSDNHISSLEIPSFLIVRNFIQNPAETKFTTRFDLREVPISHIHSWIQDIASQPKGSNTPDNIVSIHNATQEQANNILSDPNINRLGAIRIWLSPASGESSMGDSDALNEHRGKLDPSLVQIRKQFALKVHQENFAPSLHKIREWKGRYLHKKRMTSAISQSLIQLDKVHQQQRDLLSQPRTFDLTKQPIDLTKQPIDLTKQPIDAVLDFLAKAHEYSGEDPIKVTLRLHNATEDQLLTLHQGEHAHHIGALYLINPEEDTDLVEEDGMKWELGRDDHQMAFSPALMDIAGRKDNPLRGLKSRNRGYDGVDQILAKLDRINQSRRDLLRKPRTFDLAKQSVNSVLDFLAQAEEFSVNVTLNLHNATEEQLRIIRNNKNAHHIGSLYLPPALDLEEELNLMEEDGIEWRLDRDIHQIAFAPALMDIAGRKGNSPKRPRSRNRRRDARGLRRVDQFSAEFLVEPMNEDNEGIDFFGGNPIENAGYIQYLQWEPQEEGANPNDGGDDLGGDDINFHEGEDVHEPGDDPQVDQQRLYEQLDSQLSQRGPKRRKRITGVRRIDGVVLEDLTDGDGQNLVEKEHTVPNRVKKAENYEDPLSFTWNMTFSSHSVGKEGKDGEVQLHPNLNSSMQSSHHHTSSNLVRIYCGPHFRQMVAVQ